MSASRFFALRAVLSSIPVAALLALVLGPSLIGAARADQTYPVGMKQIEFVDPKDKDRHLALAMFYPALLKDGSATPLVMPFFTNLHLYKDAEIAQRQEIPARHVLPRARQQSPLLRLVR